MKNKFKYFAAAAALIAGAAFSACQDDVDAPVVNVPVAKSTPNTTIAELKEIFWDDATNYAVKINNEQDPSMRYVISGRVISSDEQGNVFKSLVIQDETAALAFSINSYNLYLNYRVGQEIVMDVTDMYIGKYNGLQQMGMPEWYTQGNCYEVTFMAPEYFAAHAELNGLPEAAKIDTINIPNFSVLTPSPEVLRKYQSQLVKLKDVYFEDAGKELFSEYHSSGVNRNLVDRNGQTLVVRTSGYSTFWNQTLPTGNLDVVGILSYYGTTGWQFLLIDEDGCIKSDADPTLGTEDNPYSIKQVVADLKDGYETSGWVWGYMVGAVAPGVEDVKTISDMELWAPTSLPTTLVLGAEQVSGLDSTLVVYLPTDTPIRQYANMADNPRNLGKKIWIKGNFGTVMGTYGLVTSGAATDFRIEGLDIDDGTVANGDGSETSPYNVSQVVAKNPSSTTDALESSVWVKGYIVGSMPTGGSSTTLSGTNFSTADAATTNLVLGPTPDCTDYSQCIGIQLPTGAVRNALNLASNPGNLGKVVALQGDLMKYCGGPGVKNVTAYKLDDNGTPSEPTPVEAVSSIDQNFDSATTLPAGWTDVNIAGDKSWYIATFNGNNYASMTGYKGTAPFDEWLITPPVDMAQVTDKVLSFDTQVNGYGSTTSKFEVYVLTSDDPKTATKTQLQPALPTAPASGYSDWKSSGNLDLSAFSGVIYIGFRYEATADANFATWCLDNVKLNAGNGGTTPTPDPEPNPDPNPSGDGSKDSPLWPAELIALNPTSTSAAVATDIWAAGYIVGFYNGSTVKGNESFGVTDAVASNILLAPTADCTDYTKCIPIQLPSGAVRTALNLKDNPGNLGKLVEVNGDVALYGGQAGVRNTKGYEFMDESSVTPDPEPDPTPSGDGITINAAQITNIPGSSSVEGYTINIDANGGATAPAFNSGTSSVRLYAKNTLTIKGAKFTKIVVTLASDAGYRYTSFTPSVGKLNPAQQKEDTTITWEGDATEVTFTVGDKATMGSDGDSKAGQIRFSKIEIIK